MKNLNSLLLEGNIVRDPVTKQIATGKNVCTFTLASNRYYKVSDGFGEEVSYFDVEAWGKLAENAAENCKAGRGVRVVGRLKQSRWVGNDGKHYSKINVVAEHIEYKPIFAKKNSSDEKPQSTQHLDFCETEEATMESKEVIPAF